MIVSTPRTPAPTLRWSKYFGPLLAPVSVHRAMTITPEAMNSKVNPSGHETSSQQHQPDPYWMSGREQQCCLVENGQRCFKAAGNASYSKRIQKTVAQKKLRLHMDNSVSEGI